ncbi:MAG: hypothetical protein JSV91_08020 [Phycisphaerales bacterium]|nr:MAG: hypothetical protein JSV91_08020 [Phycisphaerales bacterium]
METPRIVKSAVLAALGAGSLLWAASCATTEDLAPPVNEEMVDLAAREGTDVDSLRRGRHIYVTRCAACHSPEPVGDYPVADWPGIVRRMADRTGLSESETEDVIAYVTAAHQCGADR